MTNEEDVSILVKGTDFIIQAAATTSGAKDIFSKPHCHVTDNAVMNSLIFKISITDSLVMYRAYKKSVIDELRVDTKTGSWGTQLLLRAIKRNLRIGEIPADEPKRVGGVRKVCPIRNGLCELGVIIK